MEPQTARIPTPSSVLFEDGFGQRRVVAGGNGDQLEVLTLREGLTASPTFESGVRDRHARLADFHSEHFARVRGVERAGKGRVAILSDHVPGVRLSTVLATAESHLLPIEMNAALCLLRQLVHAIAVLHDKAPDVCHGTIGPERLVITPLARLVVVEYVLGAAVEQLRYPNKQYWQELRVPVPRTFGMPHFDRRTDVTQVGATALALIMGRPLADDEFPSQVSDMTASALALSADGALEPLPLPFRVWLERALQIDSKTPFGSAPEAWAELDRVLHYSDPIAEIESLKLFLSRYQAAIGIRPVSTRATPTPMPVARILPKPTANVPTEQAAARAAMARTSRPTLSSIPPVSPTPPAPSPSLTPTATAPHTAAPKPLASPPPVTPSPASQASRPQTEPAKAPAFSGEMGFWNRKPAQADVEEAPQTPPVEQVKQAVPAAYPLSRFRLAIAAVMLVAATAGITLGARRFFTQPLAADGMGTLMVQTNPTGAAVDIDGQSRGVTPLSVALSPGRHTLKISSDGNVRSIPVTLVAGAQVSQFIELPKAGAMLGELQVRTEPSGAQVTVDGHAYGKSPLTVEGLTPGAHTVVLQNGLSSMTQEVKIEAGATASLVVPMAAPKNVPVSGWIAVDAPVQLQVFEDARLIGTSQSERIMVSAGQHQLQVVNETIGYSQSHTVTVTPGRVTMIKPRWPNGQMSFNATPWAEVWIDGRQVGETPLGNVTVPIGPHDVIFRHPDLGEKQIRAVVTLSTPARISVDMRQR